MSEIEHRLTVFVEYVRTLKGDEKGEAQVFCDRLLKAFGHEGYKEAGATLEYRVRPRRGHKGTQFADLLWRPRLLLEMKSRGTKLDRHYQQAFEYWLQLVPNRPKYVILCNFDEFWIYDFDQQMDEPVDRVRLDELPARHTALNFLFPVEKKPLFNNDRVAVTRAAADQVAQIFNALVSRPAPHSVPREDAQLFILQAVFAMFSEDFGLLPRGLFMELLEDCAAGQSSHDLIGGLFRQMGSDRHATGGRFKDILYFNGGLFRDVRPIELAGPELELLRQAAREDWSRVHPAIFGSLFQSSMDQKERHAFGGHFTSEADIQKIVLPTIVRPWRKRIAAARKAKDLLELRDELAAFRVLDPACGSGNFLYVAFRELKRLELEVLLRIHEEFGKRARETAGATTLLSTRQFFGLDINPFAVELAKVTLMLAKELAFAENRESLQAARAELPLALDAPLPLDNLDDNILCRDALFCDWPQADAIVGNPPYLGSRYIAKEHGYEYARKIHAAFPDVPKMADYCVFWFRLAHDQLPPNSHAGLVGTNSIRQNESREASLDYIVNRGGVITEAVATQVWTGDAAVHVSIVNWKKGQAPGTKKLYTQIGEKADDPWKVEEVAEIRPTLSTKFDVTSSVPIEANRKPKHCFQGQNPANVGFMMSPDEAVQMLLRFPDHKEVLFPYLIGDDLVAYNGPTRWIVDFGKRSFFEAMLYRDAFQWVKTRVMDDVLKRARKEKNATGKENTRWTRMAERWWQFRDYQPGLMNLLFAMPRYIALSRASMRPIFEFVSSSIHPDTKIQVFAFSDDYSFGILQSSFHWNWGLSREVTLGGTPCYTPATMFDTFPWPQAPTAAAVERVARAAVELRGLRREILKSHGMSLRDLYRTLELPGKNPLRDAHAALDEAVRAAYGMKKKEDSLAFLLALNQRVAAREAALEPVGGPGLPPWIKQRSKFITEDCIGVE